LEVAFLLIGNSKFYIINQITFPMRTFFIFIFGTFVGVLLNIEDDLFANYSDLLEFSSSSSLTLLFFASGVASLLPN
jgi:hypothetical protein